MSALAPAGNAGSGVEVGSPRRWSRCWCRWSGDSFTVFRSTFWIVSVRRPTSTSLLTGEMAISVAPQSSRIADALELTVGLEPF